MAKVIASTPGGVMQIVEDEGNFELLLDGVEQHVTSTRAEMIEVLTRMQELAIEDETTLETLSNIKWVLVHQEFFGA